MTKRMLIDSTHAEETRRRGCWRVIASKSTDVETSTKQQLKGNIYLAKVVRVEPSLQAAFVEYGGNRHGFLAFGEIHPDYYQIPVADRRRLPRSARARGGARRRGGRRARGRARQPPSRDRAGAPGRARRRLRARADRHASRGRARETRAPAPEPEAAEAAPEATPTEATARNPEFRRRRLISKSRPGSAGQPGRGSPPSIAQDILVAPEEAADALPRRSQGHRPSPEDAGADMAPEIGGRRRAAGYRAPGNGAVRASRPIRRKAEFEPTPSAPPEQIGGELEVEESDRAPQPRRASCATTRSRKSSAAGRSCWCRSSRRSAAPRARR